jgi:hypothetical protein
VTFTPDECETLAEQNLMLNDACVRYEKALRDARYSLSILAAYLDDPNTPWPNYGLKSLALSYKKRMAEIDTVLEGTPVQKTPLEQEQDAKNNAYRERNTVLALLARMALQMGWKAGVKHDPTQEQGWQNLLFIELPTGQASWHYSDEDAVLLVGLPEYDAVWDGHSTPDKYERVREALK